jgi:hypothetical protein
MGTYCLHFFDDAGSPTSREELDCASDAEAINESLDRAAGKAVELWCGDRKLIRWAAAPDHGRLRASAPPIQSAQSVI